MVDDSRMVRAALVRGLRGHYQCREEDNGESAWQALVLDPSLQVVLTDLSMPILDGFGLIERIRASRLPRLRTLPVLMVSGDEDEAARQRALALGATDFVTKGCGASELLARLQSLLRLAASERELATVREQQVVHAESGLFLPRFIAAQAGQLVSQAVRQQGQVSILVVGFDDFSRLQAEAGETLMQQLLLRFARLLAGKIRREDSLGHYGEGVFAVVSPGTPQAACLGFAHRVREAIRGANIAARGQRLHLSVSVGIASFPDDAITLGQELIDCAAQRMRAAMAAGGNAVQGAAVPAAMPASIASVCPNLEAALAMLQRGELAALQTHWPELGRRVLPLLAALGEGLDSEKIRLAVVDLQQRLNETAK